MSTDCSLDSRPRPRRAPVGASEKGQGQGQWAQGSQMVRPSFPPPEGSQATTDRLSGGLGRLPSMRAAGLGHTPAVGGERGMGSAGTKRQISERDTNGRFGPFTQNLHGELGSKVAASLGTPHGASPAPGWEAGDALVARARSPTLPERAYFASSSRRRPSFAPMPSYSDGVARLLVQLI